MEMEIDKRDVRFMYELFFTFWIESSSTKQRTVVVGYVTGICWEISESMFESAFGIDTVTGICWEIRERMFGSAFRHAKRTFVMSKSIFLYSKSSYV